MALHRNLIEFNIVEVGNYHQRIANGNRKHKVLGTHTIHPGGCSDLGEKHIMPPHNLI